MSGEDGLRLVSYQELATAWGVSLRTVKRWIRQDQHQGYRVRLTVRRVNAFRRFVLIRAVDADAVLARHSTVSRTISRDTRA